MAAELQWSPGAVPSAGHAPADRSSLVLELGRAAGALELGRDVPAVLDELVASARRVVPAADGASISVLSPYRQVASSQSPDALPVLLDAIQAEVGEGPCFDAITGRQPVRVPDLRDEQRWPRFVSRAHLTGAGSLLSVRLAAGDRSLGSLNLCSRWSHAFDDDSENVALLFTAGASVAIAAASTHASLRVALTGRDLIGQAKGILMERHGLGADEAFRVLVRMSQTKHRKLRDLAVELVTGNDPGGSHGAGTNASSMSIAKEARRRG